MVVTVAGSGGAIGSEEQAENASATAPATSGKLAAHSDATRPERRRMIIFYGRTIRSAAPDSLG